MKTATEINLQHSPTIGQVIDDLESLNRRVEEELMAARRQYRWAVMELRLLADATDDFIDGDKGFPFADAVERAKMWLADKQGVMP